MNLLLCTNGHPDTRPALEYGVWLAETGRVLVQAVILLGVVGKPARLQEVEELLTETADRLAGADIPYERRIQTGRPEKVIPPLAREGVLTVVGPMTSRLVWAHTLCQLLAAMETPVLHVAEAPMRLERMLLCTGGLRYAEGVVRTGGYLAQALGATVTLLHVVEPVTLEYPVANQVKIHWTHLLETDTPQARRLKEALALLSGMGVETEVRVRHGPVVHEILHEIREGEYDLVGVGSPYAARSLRRLYRPNVAIEVAEAAGRPVLIARAPPEEAG
ncbi:MAG: universal stress protein [Anaerolineae bacterium]|nr:universal stress protein [Anaerolineae bacterium]MDW8067922.1 universal stress protein [Anaerolineae bacterium]